MVCAMALVLYGNHRTIAVLSLTRRGQISPETVIGENASGAPLTAGELVHLYESEQLTTGNSNYRGLPWFDDSKVNEIVRNFKLERLFDKSRDGGRGVVLTSGSGRPFRDMKADYGYGASVREFV